MKKNIQKFSPWILASIVSLIGIMAFIVFASKKSGTENTTMESQGQNYTTQNLSIGNNVTIPVEVADTAKKRELGLSYRKSLPENQGMLFIFDSPVYLTFWMKGMNFPLDMIWIGEDNAIVDITENVPNPAPNTPEFDLPTYRPSNPAKMVLEVNAGFVKKNGIEVGDTMKLDVGN